MKITKNEVKQIIKEELENVMKFGIGEPMMAHSMPTPNDAYTVDPDGYEGEMAKNNLYNLKEDATVLCELIHSDENLEPWVQEKIAVAASMLSSVARYMKGEKKD